MATLGNTPRPAYVYDTETDTWVPIGVGAHTHDTLYVNQNIIDAKGDLIVGTADNSYDRLAKGSDGTILVSDSSTSTGLAWQPYGAIQVAGKNKIINGDFGIWQRGTSFSNPNGVYTADRFLVGVGTAVPTWTISQQTFTPGTAPVSGYEGSTFLRAAVTSQGSSTLQQLITRLEDVRLLAGQTATFSFWAKAGASLTINSVKVGQNFGSGGSSAIETSIPMTGVSSITTSWTRYTGTVTIPSISGKTIGTSSYLYLLLEIQSSNGNYTFDTWGWQLEAGSVATPFTTATGTIQGELAACQRYYVSFGADSNAFGYPGQSIGFNANTTVSVISVPLPVPMRIAPTSIDYSALANWQVYQVNGGAQITVTSFGFDGGTNKYAACLNVAVASGLTSGAITYLRKNNNANATIGFSAEL